MTTPHAQEPAEGAQDPTTDGESPSNPDKTGASIDSGNGPADKDDDDGQESQFGQDPQSLQGDDPASGGS